MVQRKVSNKLGVLPDHVKSEGRMANLKPTLQHQDCKNKAADLKIKMKMSRSMKHSDIKSPRSFATKRISLPGKPPTGDVPSIIATPQKQPPNRAMEWSPNHMKSTSSADARRGSSQVSSRNSHTVSDSKLFRKRESSSSKGSSIGSELAETETKSFNVKLVRSLTKTPSFKIARSIANKYSRVAISADINVQRATCSSNMKDSKFPQYLVLNPGGTESERTSVEKVCRYTYCSLNGHHHSPVPPLKLLLSTRRRSLKTQRCFKVEALSPRRAKKSVVDESKKVENTPLCHEEEFSCSTTPLMQEEEMDYIEIYTSNKEYYSGANKDSPDANIKGNFSFVTEPEDTDYVPYWGSDVKQVAESLSDGPPYSEIDFEENHQQYGDDILEEVKIAESHPDSEKDFQFNLVQEELDPERTVFRVNPERDKQEVIKAADTSSEAKDIGWEDMLLFSEADYFIRVDCKSHSDSEEAYGKAEIKANSTDVTSHDEIQSDEIVEYISEGESGYSEKQFVIHYPEWDVNNQDAEAGSFEDDQCSPDKETQGEAVATREKVKLAESADIVSSTPLAEDPTVEGMAEYQDGESRVPEAENFKIGPQKEDNQIRLSSETIVEASSNQEENNDFQGTRTDTLVNSQTSDALILSTTERVEIHEYKCGERTNQDNDVADFRLERDLHNADREDQVAENDKAADASHSDGEGNKTVDPHQLIKHTEINDLAQPGANNSTTYEMCIENIEGESKISRISSSVAPREQDDLDFDISSSLEDCANEMEKMETEDYKRMESSESNRAAESTTRIGFGGTTLRPGVNSNEKLLDSCNNLTWIIKKKRATEEGEEPRQFNPREPNYLPLVPDREAEKVDLQHQDMNEKNSDEWMLDHVLQKAVNKLAPARKRKVALLVEAFETVTSKQV